MNRSLVDGEESSQTNCKWPSVTKTCTGGDQSYVNFSVNMVDRDRKFLPVKMGTVNGKNVQVLRDTGCTCIVIKRSLVTDKQLTGQMIKCMSVEREEVAYPEAEVYIETPFYTGIVKVICMESPIYELIVGNIPEVTHQASDVLYRFAVMNDHCQLKEVHTNNHGKDIGNLEDVTRKTELKNCDTSLPIVTRSQGEQQRRLRVKPLSVPHLPSAGSFKEFKQEQLEDSCLQESWRIHKDETIVKRKTLRYKFMVHDQLLYRQIMKRDSDEDLFEKQLVIPKKYRPLVLKTAHDVILSGHLGITKTLSKIKPHFYWPGMVEDVSRYCKSCDICQRTIPKGYLQKAKLEKMSIITTPFQRVAVDIVGPLKPTTKGRKKYILTLVDVAS